ncbi:MAG: helix-turn-helix domain-containing protein [Actinomycetota bacterium]
MPAAERAPDSEWVTPQELADELKIPVNTIYGWHAKGTAPRGVRIGKHIRYRRRDVAAWLEQR